VQRELKTLKWFQFKYRTAWSGGYMTDKWFKANTPENVKTLKLSSEEDKDYIIQSAAV
jgi:hypothetical protein